MRIEAHDIDAELGGRTVLRGVSAAFEAGSVTVVVGPNGAGKSTLLRVMAGLLKPTRGSVRVGVEALGDAPSHQLAETIAYLPQDRTVHWPLAVRHVVALGRLPYAAKPPQGRRRSDADAIAAALEAMDLVALAETPINQISGGERARVLFARALAQDCPIIIADEPTAGLDPAHAVGLFAILGRLAAAGQTIIVALHDLSLALRFATHAVVLADGRIAASGAARDCLTAPVLSSVFGTAMAVGTVGGVPAVVPTGPRR